MLSPHVASPGVPGGTFAERIAALESSLVRDALTRACGNQAEAARSLGMSYHQFRYHHRKHGLGRG